MSLTKKHACTVDTLITIPVHFWTSLVFAGSWEQGTPLPELHK